MSLIGICSKRSYRNNNAMSYMNRYMYMYMQEYLQHYSNQQRQWDLVPWPWYSQLVCQTLQKMVEAIQHEDIDHVQVKTCTLKNSPFLSSRWLIPSKSMLQVYKEGWTLALLSLFSCDQDYAECQLYQIHVHVYLYIGLLWIPYSL